MENFFKKKNFTPEAVSKVKNMVESGQLASLIQAHLKTGSKIS